MTASLAATLTIVALTIAGALIGGTVGIVLLTLAAVGLILRTLAF
jgi:hypothetical protein